MDLVESEKPRNKGGRPKGSTGIKQVNGLRAMAQATKLEQREGIRAAVGRHFERMLRSQIAHAIGIGHLYTRDKAGKYTRITNEAEADRLLTEGEEGKDFWIFMKDPSTAAFADLFDRAFDSAAKPTEQHSVKHDGTLTIRIEKPW